MQDGYHRLICEFGMGWQMPQQGGHYYDLHHSPLANAETINDIENYPWPDPLDPGRFVGMQEAARHVARVERKGVFLGRMSSGMWNETKRRIEDLAPGGGYVFAPIHIIQSDIPVENIIAMWETLQEYGIYS